MSDRAWMMQARRTRGLGRRATGLLCAIVLPAVAASAAAVDGKGKGHAANPKSPVAYSHSPTRGQLAAAVRHVEHRLAFERRPLTVFDLAPPLSITYAQLAPGGTPSQDIALPTITVEAQGGAGESAFGPVDGYIATRSATGTKTDTLLKETPQSISVVGADEIRDQAASTIQETLRYVPGVFADAYGPDSRGDYPRVRGSDPDVFLDGMRYSDAFQFNEPRIDPYTLSRVEVLRGPASMLYGATPIAGLINLISKRPLDVAKREVEVVYGSFDQKEFRTDLTGPLTPGGELLYRFIGVGRLADSQTDYVPDDRYVVNPSITWRPTAGTTWTLIGLQQKDSTGSSTAFLPHEGTRFPGPNGFIPVNRFTSEPIFDKYETTTSAITSLFEHRFNDALLVRSNMRYQYIDGVYNSMYPDVYSSPADPFLDPARRTVARYQFAQKSKKNRFTTDNNAVARFDTGPVSHKMLAGLDFRQYFETGASGDGFDPRPFDLYAPTYFGIEPLALVDEPDLKQRQTGIYLQDQMRLGPWIVLAGVRRDWVSSKSEETLTQSDEANTGRIGLMYEFANGLSPYISYAQSFNPIFGADICAGGSCKPMRGEQVEVGLKYNPFAWLTVNAAIYDTTERNRLAVDPTNPFLSVQTGEVKVRGGELEVLANITDDTTLTLAYAYTDAEVASGDNIGKRVEVGA